MQRRTTDEQKDRRCTRLPVLACMFCCPIDPQACSRNPEPRAWSENPEAKRLHPVLLRAFLLSGLRGTSEPNRAESAKPFLRKACEIFWFSQTFLLDFAISLNGRRDQNIPKPYLNPVSRNRGAHTGVTCDDDSATIQDGRLPRPFHSNLSHCAAKVIQVCWHPDSHPANVARAIS